MVKLKHDFLLGMSRIQTTAAPLVPVPQTATHPIAQGIQADGETLLGRNTAEKAALYLED